jgi:hypothetical protein
MNQDERVRSGIRGSRKKDTDAPLATNRVGASYLRTSVVKDHTWQARKWTVPAGSLEPAGSKLPGSEGTRSTYRLWRLPPFLPCLPLLCLLVLWS